ncbi:zf-TFIIB domain-containing protein [bacterium]|nr:zf-TFIIB domain-containing protein [bacterium]
MTTIQKGSTVIDLCNQCGGLWCEVGELAAIVGTAEDLPVQQDLSIDGIRANCPTCDLPLSRRYYSSLRMVVIDECKTCNGVWLDENELCDLVKVVHQLRTL